MQKYSTIWTMVEEIAALASSILFLEQIPIMLRHSRHGGGNLGIPPR